MKLLKCILTKNECYLKGKTIKPKGVMAHSTGAKNKKAKRYVQPLKTDAGYNDLLAKLGKNTLGNHWNRSGVKKCVHAFIGELADGSIATVQTLPWNHRGWHAGDDANDTHIGFEICEDNLKDKVYFDKVYKEAVELTASLCKMYNLDPLKDGVVICHSEGYKRGIASNHGDVMHWFPKHGKSMDTFRKDVAALVNGEAIFTPYKVRVTIKNLNIRTGPGTNYKKVRYIEPGTYTIVDEASGKGASKWCKLKSGVGWISYDYVTKV